MLQALRSGTLPSPGAFRYLFSGFAGVPFQLDLDLDGPPGGMGIHGFVEFRETPGLLMGVVLVAALALLTRGLHLDGFMDTCDALGGGHDRERRLQILRDPHVGAFAVVGVVLLLLIKCSALAILPADSRPWTILVVPCISRWAILPVMARFPYARKDGLGTPFVQESGAGKRMVIGLAISALVAVGLVGLPGLILIAGAALAALGVGAWSNRLLEGVTGDTYGAVVESAEAAMLVTAALLTVSDPGALRPPLLDLLIFF